MFLLFSFIWFSLLSVKKIYFDPRKYRRIFGQNRLRNQGVSFCKLELSFLDAAIDFPSLGFKGSDRFSLAIRGICEGRLILHPNRYTRQQVQDLTVIFLFLFHWTWLWVNFHRHKALTSLGADIKFPPHKSFCRIILAGVPLPSNQIAKYISGLDRTITISKPF